MTRKSGFILTLLMIANFVSGETFKKELVMEPGKKLTIDLKSGGSIQVSGWDKSVAEITLNADGVDTFEETADLISNTRGLEIEVFRQSNRHGRLDLSVKVPNRTDLDVVTNGGDIVLQKLEGTFEGKTMGGTINVSDLKGAIQISTMGGNIGVVNSTLDGKVETMGGNIMVENVNGDLDGSTMGGNVIYRNVYDKDGKPRAEGKEIKISTMGGNIELREAPMGADLHTMGGNIILDKAAAYVRAHTMGGSIEIGEIDGWVKASTMGGNVTVTMVGDPAKGKRDVDLSSMGGDITLTLPANLSCTFDLRLNITRESKKDYEIKSDFDLNIEDEDWNYSKGNPRKTIKGTGKIKDGKHLIKIETTNGDIIINKGK